MHSLMAAPTSKTITNAALWKQNSRNCHNPGPLSGAKLLSFVAGFDTHSSETAFTPLRKSIVPIPCPTWYWLAGAQAVWKTKLQAWNLQIRSQQLPVTQQWYSNGNTQLSFQTSQWQQRWPGASQIWNLTWANGQQRGHSDHGLWVQAGYPGWRFNGYPIYHQMTKICGSLLFKFTHTNVQPALGT